MTKSRCSLVVLRDSPCWTSYVRRQNAESHARCYNLKFRLLDNLPSFNQGELVTTHEPDRRRFGRLLYELRRNKSLSQQAVGDHVGVSAQNVSGWESGDYAPADRRTVAQLDKYLGGDGQLLDALGYSLKPSLETRLSLIEERLDALTSALEALSRRRR